MATTVTETLDLAMEHHRAGRLQEAERLYREILAIEANHHDCLHLLGMVAYQTGRFAEAETLFGRAIAVAPRNALFHHHLGIARVALEHPAEAAASFRTAIAIDPRSPGSRTELGLCLMREGKYDEASQALRKEIELNPDDATAIRGLGVCCFEMGLLDDAEKFTRRAVDLAPNEGSGWNNLAGILISRGEPAEAAPLYEEASRRDPAVAMNWSNRLMCEQYLPDVSEERLLALSAVWQQRYGPAQAVAPMAPRSSRILRVGFVSPDFNRAPVGYFLSGLFEALRGEAISLAAYSDTARQDDLTECLRNATHLWRDARPMDHARLGEVIREDGIDVLFDLAGHTKGNRLPVFARRAAPVQVTWAGYAGTTGLDAMDYILADRFQLPPGSEKYYRERVLRMPNDYVCYAPPSYAPDVTRLPALESAHVNFCAFHNVAKIGAPSIDTWARVLAAVPDSRIVLKYMNLDEPRAKERILGAFSSAGIARERIIIEGISPHIDMLRRYNDVDIALDSRPYSGGLTTCEALWMGVPVVTLPGTTFAGRHSLSHLNNVGHRELVARDTEDFVRIASRLAGDLPGLASLRRSLRADMASSPLCDARAFARDFLALLREIVPA